MNPFHYIHSTLHAEEVSLSSLAKSYQTPLYVYSQSQIEANFLEFDTAFGKHPHLVCYAVKANSNIAVLRVLAELGAGFDIVSAGELQRVIRAGGSPSKCIFSGVGKTHDEIEFALEVGVHCFNVESEFELYLIEQIAIKKGVVAQISIRVNPNVDAGTHPYISTGLRSNKFGIDITKVEGLYEYAHQSEALFPVGIDCHIGSQITSVEPFLDALDKVLDLARTLEQKGITIQHLDLGGGIGIEYEDNPTIDISAYVSSILDKASAYQIIVEPGRAIVGNAGIFLTKVLGIKHNGEKNFAVIDGAMNDLLRPSLYQAHHQILPVVDKQNTNKQIYDIVGPVCETGDYLGKERALAVTSGDLIAVRDAGAYGFVMSSNYNTRPMVAEVLVKGEKHIKIRKRQTISQLFADESATIL